MNVTVLMHYSKLNEKVNYIQHGSIDERHQIVTAALLVPQLKAELRDIENRSSQLLTFNLCKVAIFPDSFQARSGSQK